MNAKTKLDYLIENCSCLDPYKESFLPDGNVLINNIEINFNDDAWDLSSIAPEGKKTSNFRYYFDCIDSIKFKNALKLYVLYQIFTTSVYRQSIMIDMREIRRFFSYLYSRNLTALNDISLELVKGYFSELNCSAITMASKKKSVKSFLIFCSGVIIDKDVDGDIVDYLENVDNRALKAQLANNKIVLMPAKTLNAIRDFVFAQIEHSEELELSYYELSFYAMIYILIQTGIRPTEAMILLKDCLEEDFLDEDMPIYYLNYRSTKKSSDKYDFCKTKANSKVAFVVRKMASMAEGDNLFNKICGFREVQLNMFLYSICIEHCKEFHLLNVDDETCFHKTYKLSQLSGTSAFTQSSYFRKSVYSVQEKEIINPDDRISLVSLYQFRVYFATELHDRNVPDQLISKMMNQKDEKMYGYYVRPHEHKIRQEEIDFTISVAEDVLTDKYQIHGPKSEDRTRKMKDALDKPINTAKDIHEIAKKINEKMPMRLMEGGVCIRGGRGFDCTFDDVTDISMCAYHMCPNQHHFIFNIPYYYKLCQDEIELIDYNLAHNYSRAAEKELFKLKNIMNNRLTVELNELSEKIASGKSDYLTERFPELQEFVNNYGEIIMEVNKWKELTIESFKKN